MVNQKPMISIGGVNLAPFWLALNIQGIQNDNWTYFDYAARTARDNGLRILEVNLGWTGSDTSLQVYASHLVNAPQYLIFRISMDDDSFAPIGMGSPYSGPKMLFKNLAGTSLASSFFDALSDSWITYHRQVIKNVAARLDQLLPGRVIGIKPTQLDGGEGFIRPFMLSAGSQVPLDGSVINQNPGLAYFGDYSAEMNALYCSWIGLPGDLAGGCTLPNPAGQNAGNYGVNFLHASGNGTKNAIYYNQFGSSRVAETLARLGNAVHEVSGGKALSSFFYGYTNALEWDLTHSHHTALAQLENTNSVDILSAPYTYADSRKLGSSFTGQGPVDSAALYGKIYVHEDDTRTYNCPLEPLCSGDSFYWTPPSGANNVSWTISLLRRNILAPALHKAGSYLLDLWQGMQFAHPGDATGTAALWQGINQALMSASRIDFNTPFNYTPEVAVFVDEKSPSYQPILGQGGNDNYGRANSFYSGALEQISKAGIVYREYLLTDLLNGSIPLANIRLAIFLNAFKVSSSVSAVIQSKLKNSGRALFFIYAPGLIDDSDSADVSHISTLTGVQVSRGAGPLTGPVLTQISFPIGGATVAPFGIQDSGVWDPWFSITDPGVSGLGTYTNNGDTSLAYKSFGTHSVLYSTLPGVPAAFYRYFATNAGVHFFTTGLNDEVEAAGNTLLLNVHDSQTRTITLPWTVGSIVEDRGSISTTKCTNCSSFVVPGMAGPDSYVYRWQ